MPVFGRFVTDDTASFFRSQIWFAVALLTTTSSSPSLLKSAVPFTVQPDGMVKPPSVTTSPALSTT